MNERIPIIYNMKLRPEWIDFALEQYVKCPDEGVHRKALREYLATQIQGKVAAAKTVTQLQRTVGHRSPITRARREHFYARMCELSPEARTQIRLQILTEFTVFFEDCVSALRKFQTLGLESIEVGQLYERVVAKYGERETVFRRVRYVLQTLALLGVVENKDKRWLLGEQLSKR